MSSAPKGTLPTKACVNSTARSDSNSKPAEVPLRPLDENILRILEGLGKSRPALAYGLCGYCHNGGVDEDAVEELR